jgi:hypothetical protein
MAMDRDDATARIEVPATLLAIANEVIGGKRTYPDMAKST